MLGFKFLELKMSGNSLPRGKKRYGEYVRDVVLCSYTLMLYFRGFHLGWHERFNAPVNVFYDQLLQLLTTNFETNLCCWISCNIFYNHVVINKTINREFADDYHHQNICSSKDNYVEKPKHVKNEFCPA